jgi:hypothetical protein
MYPGWASVRRNRYELCCDTVLSHCSASGNQEYLLSDPVSTQPAGADWATYFHYQVRGDRSSWLPIGQRNIFTRTNCYQPMFKFADEHGMPGKKTHIVDHQRRVMSRSEMLSNGVFRSNVGI